MKRFEPTWESLSQFTVPEWYVNDKFGIFIHWGPYCVPAFGSEWYPRNMYDPKSREFAHHLATYGPHNQFGYKDFIPMFKAERFDAAAWMRLFKEAGARYVMPVAEHHDGFAMYDSALSDWTAAKRGPRRDVVGELAHAAREQGLKLGVSSHRAEHWFFMNFGRGYDADVNDPAFADFYGPAVPYSGDWDSKDWTPRPNAKFLEDWLARCCELVDKYRPQVFWFDWWIQQVVFEPYLQRFAAYYYNRAAEWGLDVAINYKHAAFPESAAMLDIERGQLSGIRHPFWQTDTSVSKNSWCYIEGHDYRTAASLIHDLVDIVSKNGALLLNIGPKADGTIPEPEQALLREIGAWLAINGEAIYGSRPWRSFGGGPTQIVEGPFGEGKFNGFSADDIRFTTRGESLYATCLGQPGATLRIASLAGEAARIKTVALLGGAEALSWRADADGIVIDVPEQRPSAHALTFKIT